MKKIIGREFETPLGQVFCELVSNFFDAEVIQENEYENGKSTIYKTIGHRIELVEFKIRQPLYNGETVTDSSGWIWRIEKINELDERLKLNCILTDYPVTVTFDFASGEHLDAIEAEDDNWVLHIGTEDGEVLNSRAKSSNWFPSRFGNQVDFYQSITKYIKEGFETEIPSLAVGERMHIQYLTAYDKQCCDSVSTWLAVDESMEKLKAWVGM